MGMAMQQPSRSLLANTAGLFLELDSRLLLRIPAEAQRAYDHAASGVMAGAFEEGAAPRTW